MHEGWYHETAGGGCSPSMTNFASRDWIASQGGRDPETAKLRSPSPRESSPPTSISSFGFPASKMVAWPHLQCAFLRDFPRSL